MKTTSRSLLVLAAIAPLCACDGLLPKRPTVQLYEIAPAFAGPAGPARAGSRGSGGSGDSGAPVSVVIDDLEASGLTATDRIPVVEDGYRLSPLAGAQWERRAPVLARDALVRAFEASGRASLVARPGAGLADGVMLSGELRRMRAEMLGPAKQRTCVIDVEFAARLSSLPDRRLVRTRTFTARVPVRDASPDAIVAGFSRAWEQIAGDVIAWAVPASAESGTQTAEAPRTP